MPFKILAAMVCCMVFYSAVGLAHHLRGEGGGDGGWRLPHGVAVRDDGRRTYRFTMDYNVANTSGDIIQRQRFLGEYTRGLPGGEVMWKNVTEATANGATAPYGPAQKRDFMEGFRYRNDLNNTFQPDFFKGFPPAAVTERSLVWDTGMMEIFDQNYFDELRLNEPYRVISNQNLDLAGVGKFHNRDVVLEWVGRSRRNREECAVIEFEAFLNPLEVATGGMTMKGRSDYWGRIWVSLGTKQIEYGSLNESVVAEMKLTGQSAAQTVNIFRTGSLEPVNAK